MPARDLTPYIVFNRGQWSKLRNSTPLTLEQGDFEKLLGINERISLREVREVYLPLCRLLSLHYGASLELYRARSQFFGKSHLKVPYVIGIGGSVAVGKSTTARILQAIIQRWEQKPAVEIVTTDGFLFPNRILAERGLMNKKGFPESYDTRALLNFLMDLKSGKGRLKTPLYSHLEYDIMPGKLMRVDKPDVVIIEGLNVLQSGRRFSSERFPGLVVSDFFDFSIYVDADEAIIKQWFIERFLVLMKTAFKDRRSYFHKYSFMSREEAVEVSGRIWDEINAVNLHDHIAGTKFHADLILGKGENHFTDQIMLRKI